MLQQSCYTKECVGIYKTNPTFLSLFKLFFRLSYLWFWWLLFREFDFFWGGWWVNCTLTLSDSKWRITQGKSGLMSFLRQYGLTFYEKQWVLLIAFRFEMAKSLETIRNGTPQGKNGVWCATSGNTSVRFWKRSWASRRTSENNKRFHKIIKMMNKITQ